MVKKITNEDVINFHSQGLSDRHSAKILHCCHSTFRFRRMKLGLNRNFDSQSSKHVPLSDYEDYIKKAQKNINKKVGNLRKKGNRLYKHIKEYNERPEIKIRKSKLRIQNYLKRKIKKNKRCIDCNNIVSFQSKDTKRCNHCRGEKTNTKNRKKIFGLLSSEYYIGTKEISRRAKFQWNTTFKHLNYFLEKGMVGKSGRVKLSWKKLNTTPTKPKTK